MIDVKVGVFRHRAIGQKSRIPESHFLVSAPRPVALHQPPPPPDGDEKTWKRPDVFS